MTVDLNIESGVATVTIIRTDRLNALDDATRAALLDAIVRAGDSPDVGVVVLTGAGRAFCVGQDLAAGVELADADVTVRDTYNPIVEAITRLDKPVVAGVNGPAVGAGMGLALACDVVVMSDEAFMSCAFSQVALVPDTGTSLALVRLVGHLKAFDIATTARRIPAAEALAAGLVTEVVAAGELDAAVGRHVSALQAGSASAIALTKQIFRSIDATVLTQSLELEARGQGVAARHPDHAEGVAAFDERRPPSFGGAALRIL
jgi:2-(1,2-epoxy-1,2-dihydrophenyl)acetyl-CoA isomerase